MKGIIYFCEVQFQRDERLYERLFGEAFLYFYRQRDRYQDWQAVVIYPSRRTEQQRTHPYRALLQSDQVHCIYLDELGDPQQLPLGIALMLLTTIKEEQAPTEARRLLARTQQETANLENQQAIIELITVIMVYRFTAMSRQEVEAMLGLSLQDTRVYQEAKEEGRQEGHQEGRQEGRLTEATHLVLRQLTRRYGELPATVRDRISSLTLPQLENLSDALLDFTSLADLESWLADQGDD